jgi:hypothetical protein
LAKVQNSKGKYSHSATKGLRDPELVKLWKNRQSRLYSIARGIVSSKYVLEEGKNG